MVYYYDTSLLVIISTFQSDYYVQFIRAATNSSFLYPDICLLSEKYHF